jgi:putative ABC transport system substrate-binding protein
MQRREFILGAGFNLLALTTAGAQTRGGVPVVGFLGFASEQADRPFLEALRKGLGEQGYVVGQTILLESRHAGGDMAQATRFMDEMVRRPVDVFVAPGPAAARFLRRATQIPIVAMGLPPMAGNHDLFESLAKPGGNLTGFSYFGEALSEKRIEALREMLPGLSVLGILHNSVDPVFRDWGALTESAVRAQGIQPVRIGLSSSSPAEVAELLGTLRAQGAGAVIVVNDFLTYTMQDEIVRTATRLGIATVVEQRPFAEGGALMLYGADIPDLFAKLLRTSIGLIKGERASDLPIQLATKLQLVINLKTAKALNISIPNNLLALADEVIE